MDPKRITESMMAAWSAAMPQGRIFYGLDTATDRDITAYTTADGRTFYWHRDELTDAEGKMLAEVSALATAKLAAIYTPAAIRRSLKWDGGMYGCEAARNPA